MIHETIERLPSEIVQGFRNLLRHDSITCAISIVWAASMR